MGQKTNSNILRLKPNSYALKSKYFCRTTEESSLLIYQELQIKNYINQFLIRNGFHLYNYKIEINNSTLFI